MVSIFIILCHFFTVICNRASPEKHSRMFSSCSVADWDVSLNMGIAACLTENPQPTFPQKCGNSHLERGEECDCGTPEVSYLSVSVCLSVCLSVRTSVYLSEHLSVCLSAFIT